MTRMTAVCKRIILMLVGLLICAGSGSVALAESPDQNDILLVQDAVQPERPRSMPMSAGYLKLQNLSDADVYIVDVTSPEYQSVSIHRSVQVDGVHEMETVCPLKIAAGQQLIFEPGGLHLMLHKPLVERKAGDQTTIHFVTDEGQTITFKLAVTRS